MTRRLSAAMVVVTFLLPMGIAKSQDERPAEGRAMPLEQADAAAEEAPVEASDAEAPRENFLIWFVGALGWRYTLLLPLSGLASFVFTAVLVVAGKGRTTGAAVAFLVAIPFLIGILGMFDGLIASSMVIARSSASPRMSELATGLSMSLVAPMVGMVLMAPSYLLATFGLSLRAMQNDAKA